MKLNKLLKASITTIALLALSSCNGPTSTPDDDKEPDVVPPDYNVVEGNHYLDFTLEGASLLKLVVDESDTVEELEPFFPTIPFKEGRKGVWNVPAKIWEINKEIIVVTGEYIKL